MLLIWKVHYYMCCLEKENMLLLSNKNIFCLHKYLRLRSRHSIFEGAHLRSQPNTKGKTVRQILKVAMYCNLGLCFLFQVEANAFEMIPQLVSLDLSYCNIRRVAAKAFAQLGSLEKLFLQHNRITELRQKTVESITGKQRAWHSVFSVLNLKEKNGKASDMPQ